MEEFIAPESWLARFKEMTEYEGDAFLKCTRTSKWGVSVEVLKSEMCIIARFQFNCKTGNCIRKI